MKIYQLEIAASAAGQRIDNFVFKRFRKTPKSRIYRAIRSGEIRVNKGRIKASYKLSVGDRVRLPELQPPAQELASSAKTMLIPASLCAKLAKCILYEDQQLMVINKPAGLPVHGGEGHAYGVISILRQLRPELAYLELVHRLDKDTSGCLLLAKQRSVLLELHQGLKLCRIKKSYLAILKGIFLDKSFLMQAPLKVSSAAAVRHKTQPSASGKPAQTHFQALLQLDGMSLALATPLTGRTHQIRVHAAAMGYPILGDDRYGDRAFNQLQRSRCGSGLYLHAAGVDLQALSAIQLKGLCAAVPLRWKKLLPELYSA